MSDKSRKALLVSAAAFSAFGAFAAADRPDIIVIMTDQQTASAMSCAGNPWLKTPAMDALARDGVRFTRGYCPYPVSGPCRAGIMTGRIPFTVGVKKNADRPVAEAMEKSLGHVISDAGYECLYAGKWHVPEVNIPEEGTGFRRVSPMGDPELPAACDRALSKRDGSRPLFLVASFLDPHEICEYGRFESLPYGPVPEGKEELLPPLPANFALDGTEAEALSLEKRGSPRYHDTGSFTEMDWRRYIYSYYRLVERVDAELGRLIRVLKKHGLYDNAFIFFCSDHGDGVASHQWNQKWALYEESVNVPVILKAPKGCGLKGKVNDKALTNIGLDIYATVCDYAGVRTDPEVYLGKSLRPVLEGSVETLHDNVYIETRFEGVEIQGWSLVSGRYKYVLYQWGRNREALYDLSADRGETVNLIADPSCREELHRLRKELLIWAERIGNPLCLRNIRQIVRYQ